MPVDHYENFPVASILLPAKLRRPVEVIYRFARGADDIADEGTASDAERLGGLAVYMAELDRIECGEPPLEPQFSELAEVIGEWKLPLGLFRDLLNAFAQDVVKKRYDDYPQLLDYCRRSANPVGRLLVHLVDRASEDNLYRSDCICSALQLINFWQDIAIDWTKGRVYLPQADLEHFGIDESQIAEGRCDAGAQARRRKASRSRARACRTARARSARDPRRCSCPVGSYADRRTRRHAAGRARR